MITGIYSITSPSGNQYIGSACDMKRRWAKHVRDLQSGQHGNINLQRAFKKYGLDKLSFAVLLVCRRADLLMFEQRAIDALCPAYNIAPIAGSGLGIVRSEAFKNKVSIGLTGRIVSAETRAKIGAKHRGKKVDPALIKRMRDGLETNPESRKRPLNSILTQTKQAKAKRSASLVGRPVSQATRDKISASLKGRKHSPERIAAIMAGKGCAAIVQQNGS